MNKKTEFKLNTLIQVCYFLECESMNTALIEKQVNDILDKDNKEFKSAIKELNEAEIFF